MLNSGHCYWVGGKEERQGRILGGDEHHIVRQLPDVKSVFQEVKQLSKGEKDASFGLQGCS